MIDTSPENKIRLLADVSKELSVAGAPENLRRALARICEFLGASTALVALWDEEQACLQFRMWHNIENADVAVQNAWYRTVRGGAPTADAFFRGEPVYVQDLAGDSCPPEYRGLRGWGTRYALGSYAAVPLSSAGIAHGVLSLSFTEPRPFEAAERDLLATLAGQISVAIQFDQARDAVEGHRRALERQNALLWRIVDNAPWIVAYFNRDLIFEWVNPAALRLSPVSGESFVGKSLRDVFPRIEWPNPRFEAAFRNRQPVHVRSNPLVTGLGADERTTWWDMVLCPVPGESGETEGILLQCLDVTERIEAERHQRSRIEQLEELDRLKRDFLNVASHELKTPLSTILGYSEFLEDDLEGPLTGGQRAFVGYIQESGKRLQAIVEDILDYARMEAGTFSLSTRDCDLGIVVNGAVMSLQPQAAAAGVTLRCGLPGRPLAMQCDPQRIGQVVLNLVGNAIKFSERGGTVSVSLRRRGQEAVVRVEDAGIGIAENHMSRLFEKFFQADPSNTRVRGGAGLGLAICRSLVEAHGGRIWASSKLGAGSTFEFALPIG